MNLRTLNLKTMFAAAGLLALGACATASNDPPAMSPEEEIYEAEPGDAEVEVILLEKEITLSEQQIPAGSVVFHIRNMGDVVHDFGIRHAETEPDDEANENLAEITFTLGPDNTEDLEVELDPGVYVIVCTVGNHEFTGETATLRVG